MPHDSLARSVVASGLSLFPWRCFFFHLPSPLSLFPQTFGHRRIPLSLSLSSRKKKIEKIKKSLLLFYEIAIEKENPSTSPPSQDSSRRRFGGLTVSNRLSISPVSLNICLEANVRKLISFMGLLSTISGKVVSFMVSKVSHFFVTLVRFGN